MKKKLMISLDKEIHQKLISAAPPYFRSLFIEVVLEEFFNRHSPEEIKEKVFKDFDRKAVRERLINLFNCNFNENLNKIDRNSGEEFKKSAPEIEKEIDEMW
ncbi:hypothetical protein [Desulfurobacterium atlanticum]|uniref:Uncharacterized protein n=1 Tax=Desulfurobacterium atlanticum TaxID=240169 RepID=A0A238YRM5_9BACT|nr:hypothetical protein [Desulfurobacterium atlanticum]SNR73660.1 hypothetical protein SAMN06265340_104131 [Desulfurobacterium atlanticum]